MMNKKSKLKWKKKGLPAMTRYILLVGFLLWWELFARSGVYNTFYTSYPTEILADMYEFLISGELGYHAMITLNEAMLGLFFGVVVGVSLGVLFSQFRFLASVFTPFISAIAGIPQLTLSPLYVLWFGFGLKSKVILASMMVFFRMFSTTYNAIRNLDQHWIEAAHLLGASPIQTLVKVVIPASSPWILSGIRGGIGSCVLGAIMGEYLGAKGGFGWVITFAASYFNIKRVLGCVLLLMLFNRVLNRILDWLEKRLLHWRSDTQLTFKEAK